MDAETLPPNRWSFHREDPGLRHTSAIDICTQTTATRPAPVGSQSSWSETPVSRVAWRSRSVPWLGRALRCLWGSGGSAARRVYQLRITCTAPEQPTSRRGIQEPARVGQDGPAIRRQGRPCRLSVLEDYLTAYAQDHHHHCLCGLGVDGPASAVSLDLLFATLLMGSLLALALGLWHHVSHRPRLQPWAPHSHRRLPDAPPAAVT